MAKTDITRQKIKSKISGIKRINDNPKSLVDNVFNQYKDNLDSTDGVVKKSVNNFTSKSKGRTENKKDIFSEILDVAEGFLGTDKEDPMNPKKKPLIKSKLLRYSKQSTVKTIQESQQIITDQVKKSFFEGQGGCSSDTMVGSTPLTISPKEFDFINMLKIDPTSISGKVMYESQPDPGIGVQFNRALYNTFDSSPYNFISKDSTTLFSLTWDVTNQRYNVNITNPTSTRITDFIDQYYNTIEYPNVEDVLKNAMYLTLQGDGSESTAFKDGMNSLNRICTKLFSVCGKSTNTQPLLNNTPEQLDEDEIDIQNYFDFDDVEGIDLDDEDSRNRRVLKFRDCDNFEIPTNANHIEDFAYLLDSKTLDENINNTLNKAASDAFEQSGGSIYFDGFQLSLTSKYILQIPKAIIASVLSPKMFFPIVVSYKLIKDETLTVKDLMKKLYNMFYYIIRDIFWVFIKNFWGFIKKDLLGFVRKTAEQIAVNKLKKIKAIILSLISFLIRALETGISSCTDIFNLMLNTISSALNKSVKIPIPGLLLVLSNRAPGFSTDRAYMDAIERIEAVGINTGPIYGTENKLPSFVKSIIDAYSGEMDTNAYVEIALQPTTIVASPGAALITPLVKGVGKIF